MATNLMQAHYQWSTRPADERFNSLDELVAATKRHKDESREKTIPWASLEVVEDKPGNLALIGPAKIPASLTHYATGQLSARVGAPANYIRELPAALAVENLNYGLRQRSPDGNDASLLFRTNGETTVRAIMTESYERVWDYEIADRLRDTCGQFGLVPARQTFNWDGGALAPESERPPALYASDHDMFAFVMSADRAIRDPMGNMMYRGIFVSNSEVGDRKLSLTQFYFNEMCANHIVWGADGVIEVALVHRGTIRNRWQNAQLSVRRMLDKSAYADETKLQEVARMQIAGTRDEVLDTLFGKRSLMLSRKTLAAGYDANIPEKDGDPRSPWGMAQGLTRYSQTLGYTDERTAIDKAAGKLLQFAF